VRLTQSLPTALMTRVWEIASQMDMRDIFAVN